MNKILCFFFGHNFIIDYGQGYQHGIEIKIKQCMACGTTKIFEVTHE